jgi:hypothetical protein
MIGILAAAVPNRWILRSSSPFATCSRSVQTKVPAVTSTELVFITPADFRVDLLLMAFFH